MYINSPGIILKGIKYGENDYIATIYTKDAGIKVFRLNQSMGKVKIKSLLFPLAVVQILSNIKVNREIHFLKEISLLHKYKNLPFDPIKGSVLLFFNELFIRALKEEEPDTALFNFIYESLKLLDDQKPLHPSYHLSVMLHLTKFLGFFPERKKNIMNKFFDFKEGSFVEYAEPDREVLDHETSKALNELIETPFYQYKLFTANRSVRNALLDALIIFYQIHSEGFGLMRSPGVIRTLFD